MKHVGTQGSFGWEEGPRSPLPPSETYNLTKCGHDNFPDKSHFALQVFHLRHCGAIPQFNINLSKMSN